VPNNNFFFGQLSSAVKIIVFYNLSFYCRTLVALAQSLLFLETHKLSIFSFFQREENCCEGK
jgi:hypothetical protein